MITRILSHQGLRVRIERLLRAHAARVRSAAGTGGGGVNAEQIWTRARDLHGHVRDRRAPSAGIRTVLLALADGPAHGSEVARRADQAQPNVTAVWLPKLFAFGFVDFTEDRSRGHQGGGRRALVWELTSAGRELVAALTEGATR